MNFASEMCNEMSFSDDFDYENSTMHAIVNINGTIIYLTDGPSDYVSQGRVEVTLELDSKIQIDNIWVKVKEKNFKILKNCPRLGKDGMEGLWIQKELDGN